MDHALIYLSRGTSETEHKANDGMEVFLYQYLRSIITADSAAFDDPDFNFYLTSIRNSAKLSKDLKDVLDTF